MSYSKALFGAAAIALTILATPASASDVMVKDAWARASAGAVKNGGAFMTVTSHHRADRLISASANVSKRVEIHNHINDDGVMRMREVEGIDVPAGDTVMLKPGGYHVMFMGLKAPLKEGEVFPVTLTFEKAGNITVDVTVKKAGASGHGQGHKHSHNHSHDHGHKH